MANKLTQMCYLAQWFVRAKFFGRRAPMQSVLFISDRCNLSCKHCSVYNHTNPTSKSYEQIREELKYCLSLGSRFVDFEGGEPFLWRDGDREHHNAVRGDTYDTILNNIAEATSDNICFYMAINQINQSVVGEVCDLAKKTEHVRAVSFNFHTPYPDTRELALTKSEKAKCCEVIRAKMDEGCPVFNLKSAFPYLIDNSFPTPCHQCVVMENGKLSTCGRCIEVPGLYIHLPFCRKICHFCPYCKEPFERAKADRYIDALLSEIHMVGSQYEGRKKVTSLYFGGGTPAR